MATPVEPPLIVVVGPTASGKSSVALNLAQQHNGEIICSDSRTIYRGMDIGTAKPSREDQEKVPHWGLDLVDPGDHFSAADFKAYAVEKIAEIRRRGHVPIMVGGTGLYVDSVIFDYQFGTLPDTQKRTALEEMSVLELQEYCFKNNINLPENSKNKRYLIRAIERHNEPPKRLLSPINNCIIVGITTYKVELRARIHSRSEHIFSAGVVQEAERIASKFGWDSEAMTGNVYRLIGSFLAGDITYAELLSKFEVSDWHLAKKQLTWLNRNHYIKWMPLEDVEHFIAKRLAPPTKP